MSPRRIPCSSYALFLVRKIGCDGFVPSQRAEERIEAPEAMFLSADGLIILYEVNSWVWRDQRH